MPRRVKHITQYHEAAGESLGAINVGFPIGRMALCVSGVGGALTSWEVNAMVGLPARRDDGYPSDTPGYFEALSHTTADGTPIIGNPETDAYIGTVVEIDVAALVLDTADGIVVDLYIEEA